MRLETRQEAIIELLQAHGIVEVDDLAERFGVTTQTIRMDLRDLSDRGRVTRTRGGATLIESATNRQYTERRKLRAAEKRAIGQLAASLIPNKCSVALNIGTTTEQVASALAGHRDLVVLSNNVNVINRLINTRATELHLVGGAVRPSDGAVIGGEAVEFISRYKVDYSIIGASALDSDGAILDFDAREVAVADEGPGIPADEQSRLFDVFGQTSVRPTGGEKSTGLGHAIAARIVEEHKGAITVESILGKGSVLRILLPIERRDPASGAR